MITKTSYRDQVRILLVDKMTSGQLNPGQTLSLASISRELDVSVTPIREALTQLESSKLLRSIPNRGFIIPELSDKEAKNLYELIAALELLAIENSNFTTDIINKLEKQQEIFLASKNAIDRVNSDLKFHDILCSNYDNSTVVQLMADIKTRIFFYEVEFMTSYVFKDKSNHHHNEIIKNIKSNNINEVKKILKQNWLQILDFKKSK